MWAVAAIGPDAVAADAARTVSFSGGTVSGRVGINRFSGRYEATDDEVRVGPIMSTKMAGPPDLMTLETRFHDALAGSHAVDRVGADLVIGRGDSAIRLTPDPTGEPPPDR